MIRRIVSVVIAAIFLCSSVESAVADVLQPMSSGITGYRSSEIRGAAGMVQFKVPFGGRASGFVHSKLSLTAGLSWQERYDNPHLPGRYLNTAVMEIGYSFEGQPVLKLGSLDLRHNEALRAAAEEDDRAGRNRTALIVIGVIAGAVLIYVLVCNGTFFNNESQC